MTSRQFDPATPEFFKAGMMIPLWMMTELELVVVARHATGDWIHRSVIVNEALSQFLEQGGLSSIRGDERFHRDRIMAKPHKHVSFQFPSRDIGELRQQILEERAAGWHWTDSGAMTVALMHYLGRGHPFERLTIDAALTDPTLVARLEEKAAQQGRTVTGVVLELILGYLDDGDEPESRESSSSPSPDPPPPSSEAHRRGQPPEWFGPDTPAL